MLGRFNHVFHDVQPRNSGTVPVAVTALCQNDGYVGGTEYGSAAIAGQTCGLLHQHPPAFMNKLFGDYAILSLSFASLPVEEFTCNSKGGNHQKPPPHPTEQLI
jgi:hypothetical protein